MAGNWISPSGHNDLDTWSAEANAYDDNTSLYAHCGTSGGELELTLDAPIACDKIRIYASDYEAVAGHANPNVTISAYWDGSYHIIFSGAITKQTWEEKYIASGLVKTVTKAKISGTLAASHYLYLYEFDFNSLPLPTVETDACSGVAPTSFDANGDLKTTATTRGFHYSKVYDGFEWGSDTDPLSDDGGAIDWTISVAGTSKAEIDTAEHYSGTRSARLYRDGTNTPYAEFSQSPLTSSQRIGMRVRKTSTGDFVLYHSDASSTIGVRFEADEEVSYRAPGGWVATGVSITINTWHHLVIQNVDWVAKTFDIYLNGLLIKSAAPMNTTGSVPSKVRIYNFGGTSNVFLDELGVWDVEDEDGSFAEGEYDLEISGLDTIATYYVQAFAENAAGFGYGVVVSLTTAFIPTHVEAIGTVVAPTVILSSTSCTPTPLTSVSVTIDPQVILGSTDSSPPPATSICKSVMPSIVGALASAVALSTGADVFFFATEYSPNPATAIAATTGEAIQGSLVLTPTPASVIAQSPIPTVPPTSQLLVPEAAIAITFASKATPPIYVKSSYGTEFFSDSTLYVDVTLDPVSFAVGKSFPFVTFRAESTWVHLAMISAELRDESGGFYQTLRLERLYGVNFTAEVWVDWQVITGDAFTVQTGETNLYPMTSGGTEGYHRLVTIDNVDLNKSFIVHSTRCRYFWLTHGFVAASFDDGETLHFETKSNISNIYPTLVRWYIVTWDGATVYHGDTDFLASTTDITDSFGGTVNRNHAFLLHSYNMQRTTVPDIAFIGGSLDSDTSAKFERLGIGTSGFKVRYFVVEHPDMEVQAVEASMATSGTSVDESINPVDIHKTFLPSVSQGNFYIQNSSSSYLSRGWSTRELLPDGSACRIQRVIPGGGHWSHVFVCTIAEEAITPITPTPIEAIATVDQPTVIYGSVTIAPTAASTIAQVFSPSVIYGSIIITPAISNAIALSVAPSIMYGSVAITPTPADTIAASVLGAWIMDSITVTPTALTAVAKNYGPTVDANDVIVAPTAVSAIAVVVLPTTVLGSITIVPTAISAMCTVDQPTVIGGSMIIGPVIATAIATTYPPTVVGGDLILTSAPVDTIAQTSPPLVVLSSMVVTPTPVNAVTSTLVTVIVADVGHQTKMRLYTETYHDVRVTTETYHDVEVLTKTYHDVTIWTGESNMAIRRDWERGETIPIWAEVKLVSTGALYSPVTGGLVIYVYDPDGTVISTINGVAMTEDSTGMFVYYWNSPADADLGWHRAKGKVTDGSGDTVKITIENGGFNLYA